MRRSDRKRILHARFGSVKWSTKRLRLMGIGEPAQDLSRNFQANVGDTIQLKLLSGAKSSPWQFPHNMNRCNELKGQIISFFFFSIPGGIYGTEWEPHPGILSLRYIPKKVRKKVEDYSERKSLLKVSNLAPTCTRCPRGARMTSIQSFAVSLEFIIINDR